MGIDAWPSHPDRHVRGAPIHSDLHRVMIVQEGLGYPASLPSGMCRPRASGVAVRWHSSLAA
jgi:hypothetical protein